HSGRRRVVLTLANAAQGCVFLLRTAAGSGVCGLGEMAPVACRTHPADPAAGVPAAIREPAGCGDATEHMSGRDVTEPLHAWAGDRAEWLRTIARWNAIPVAHTEGATTEDFQRYLLEAQPA